MELRKNIGSVRRRAADFAVRRGRFRGAVKRGIRHRFRRTVATTSRGTVRSKRSRNGSFVEENSSSSCGESERVASSQQRDSFSGGRRGRGRRRRFAFFEFTRRFRENGNVHPLLSLRQVTMRGGGGRRGGVRERDRSR